MEAKNSLNDIGLVTQAQILCRVKVTSFSSNISSAFVSSTIQVFLLLN